jgi:Uma2 family endonuclease
MEAGGRRVRPDLIVYRADEHDELTPRVTGRPLLVVEVLSRNVGRDVVLTVHRYARAGLPQYRLVNPEGSVEILNLESQAEGLFRIGVRLTDTVQAVTLADGTEVTVDPKALFVR